jgi:hypothetical protein
MFGIEFHNCNNSKCLLKPSRVWSIGELECHISRSLQVLVDRIGMLFPRQWTCQRTNGRLYLRLGIGSMRGSSEQTTSLREINLPVPPDAARKLGIPNTSLELFLQRLQDGSSVL